MWTYPQPRHEIYNNNGRLPISAPLAHDRAKEEEKVIKKHRQKSRGFGYYLRKELKKQK